MTWRQSLLKAAYPLIMLKGKLFPDKNAVQVNTAQVKAPSSFYDLTMTANNGTVIGFDQFKGKKILLVNTASDCGFTAQYTELERLQLQYKDKLVILGFPANDFKEQEKENDNAIAAFCKINYGVTFQLMQKSQVIKGDTQNAVFAWLSHAEKTDGVTSNLSGTLVNTL